MKKGKKEQKDAPRNKFDAWCESMEGLQSAEVWRNDINTLLGGEKGKNEKNKNENSSIGNSGIVRSSYSFDSVSACNAVFRSTGHQCARRRVPFGEC